ncbi:MAG TPA: YARHG domain-containing protein, partial [Pyrinomonadaceae bacterium]|nr:YARHG domain-containing protein [Pyrinomonadaceae bacterium]
MKSPVTSCRFLAMLFLLALLSASSSVFAQDEYANIKTWESFDFRGRNITAKDLSALTLYDLKFVRGIVFGKHGRIFKDPDIKRYLQSRDWYKPDAEFKNSSLNDTERKNLDVIRLTEAAQHETVEPGDMRLYENKALTRRKLGTHTNAEWTVLAAE